MKKHFLTISCLLSALVGASCTTNVSRGQSLTSSASEQFNETFVQAILSDIADKEEATLVFEFFDKADLSGSPLFNKAMVIDLTGESGDVEKIFSLIALDEGSYYLRTFLDEDGDGSLDSGEISGTHVDSEGAIKKIKIGEDNRQAVYVTLN